MDSPITAKAAILQALISGPSYGIQLVERVDERTKGQVRLHQGAVYPALRSLEREGMLRSFDGPSLAKRGGRPRRYYELTALGLAAANQQREGLLSLLLPLRPVEC